MKNIKMNKILKKILILVLAIYLIYTFIMQQQTLNAYRAEEENLNNQILTANEKKEHLTNMKNNISSKEYIEEIAREKLDMYLPNERIYVDVSK